MERIHLEDGAPRMQYMSWVWRGSSCGPHHHRHLLHPRKTSLGPGTEHQDTMLRKEGSCLDSPGARGVSGLPAVSASAFLPTWHLLYTWALAQPAPLQDHPLKCCFSRRSDLNYYWVLSHLCSISWTGGFSEQQTLCHLSFTKGTV